MNSILTEYIIQLASYVNALKCCTYRNFHRKRKLFTIIGIMNQAFDKNVIRMDCETTFASDGFGLKPFKWVLSRYHCYFRHCVWLHICTWCACAFLPINMFLFWLQAISIALTVHQLINSIRWYLSKTFFPFSFLLSFSLFPFVPDRHTHTLSLFQSCVVFSIWTRANNTHIHVRKIEYEQIYALISPQKL